MTHFFLVTMTPAELALAKRLAEMKAEVTDGDGSTDSAVAKGLVTALAKAERKPQS